jgi:signal transduction histidine kinase
MDDGVRVPPAALLVHDIRSPASVVVGALHEMMVPGLSDDDRTTLVELALRSANQILGLADEILASARGSERVEAEQVVDTGHLVASVVRSMRHREDARSLSVTAVRPDGTVNVAGHYRALTRLLANLVGNAIRHARSVVRVCAESDGDVALLSVEDDGPGVAPELVGRLFQPWATSGGKGGTGLGLLIVDRIARAHGGLAGFEGSPAGGARFVVRLPRLSGDG